MIFKTKPVFYYSSKTPDPVIVSPKSSTDWTRDNTIAFSWLYNGIDVQTYYQIQIFDLDISSTGIPSSWSNNDDAGVGSPVVDDTVNSSIQSTTIDLDGIIDTEGVFPWRIRTKGALNQDWSNWIIDGRIKIDLSSPVIKNVTIESPSSSNKLASVFSDLSQPYLFSNRTLEDSTIVKDRHIERSGRRGLFISYDYKNNAIILRAQKGSTSASDSNPRYYGMIAFHATEDSVIPDYTIQSIVRNVQISQINKNQNNNFYPYEQIKSADLEEGRLIHARTSDLIYMEKKDLGSDGFIPKGFPKFWDDEKLSAIKNVNASLLYPVGMDVTSSFVSLFPMHTRKIDKITISGALFENIIELRYPYPYQDIFIIFDESMTKILAYGQYGEIKPDGSVWHNPTIIIGIENALTKSSSGIFENSFGGASSAASTFVNVAAGGSLADLSFNRTAFGSGLRSFYMFFNITATEHYDDVIKIYLNKKPIQYIESNGAREFADPVSETPSIPFIEFCMSPDADCGYLEPGDLISINEVFIGKSAVPIRALSVFESDPSKTRFTQRKKIIPLPNDSVTFTDAGYTDLATSGGPSPGYRILQATKFGVGSDILYFNSEASSYNAAFKIKIPSTIQYVPYYHPGSINYLVDDTDAPPVPHIYDASPNNNNIAGWDSLNISTENDEIGNNIKIKSGLIYESDYVKFFSNGRTIGQYEPYLYNFNYWKDIKSGIIGRLTRYADSVFIKDASEYNFYGQTVYDDGYDTDYVLKSNVNTGLFGVVDVERDLSSNTISKVYIKDFVNFLFKRSFDIKLLGNLSASDDYTKNAVIDDSNDIVLASALYREIGTNDRTPSWIYKTYDGSDSIVFEKGLIKFDESAQGYFGVLGSSIQDWMAADESNSFGGHYLVYGNKNVQLKRVYSVSSDNYLYLSSFDRFAIAADETATISGDIFSLGNIFGDVVIIDENNKRMRLYFDIDEPISGIKDIKVFECNVMTDAINDGSYQETGQFWNNLDDNGNDTKAKILMQKINNTAFNLTTEVGLADALVAIGHTRSPMSLIEHYFDNKMTVWNTMPTAAKNIIVSTNQGSTIAYTTISLSYEYGDAGFFYEINSNSAGFKIIYIQVRDFAGNVSNVYAMPIYVKSTSTSATIEEEIESATVSIDDGKYLQETTAVVNGDASYNFSQNLLYSDSERSRSIVVKDLVTKNADGTYQTVSAINDFLIGFSDNYALNYNSFVPFSSIHSWQFNRPLAIRIKSPYSNIRLQEPDWYFDPNHVRHYWTSDTVSINNQIIKMNTTLNKITLLGFMNEGAGRTNPVAEKIYNFREEFIGKKLVLGSKLDMTFTILHVFKTQSDSALPTVQRHSSSIITNIDPDNRAKIWIVIEDIDGIASLILSRKLQYIPQIERRNDNLSSNTGWRSGRTGNYELGGMTINFGNYLTTVNPIELPVEIETIANQGLVFVDEDTLKTEGPELYIYVSTGSSFDSSTNTEGWTSQIFRLYDNNTGPDRLSKLKTHEIVGLKIYNRLVFGEDVNVSAIIIDDSFTSGDYTFLVIENGRIDKTMSGLAYSIVNTDTDISVDIDDAIISDIDDTSTVIKVPGDILSLLDPDDLTNAKYQIVISIQSLDSKNETTGDTFSRGWWPSISGIVLPTPDKNLAEINSSNVSQNIKFAVISNGAFFIQESGYYKFKVVVDNNKNTYADFSIDYLQSGESFVNGLIEDWSSGSLEYKTVVIGGTFKSGSPSFYLKRGWHTGRLRYINSGNDANKTSFLRVEYSKPGWSLEETTYFVPFIGDNSNIFNLMARAYRTVYCRIYNQLFNYYPNNIGVNNTNNEKQFCKATLGFNKDIEQNLINIIQNGVVEVEQSGTTGTLVNKSTVETTPVYGGQKYEKMYAIYESSIFDGGADFKFWRTLSWSPDESEQPANTSLEFYIRTGATEQELLTKKWNNIGTTSNEVILDAFTISGSDIINFSFTAGSSDTPNRFIQFKMILISESEDVTPSVSNATIVYSKQNTVNFFTTDFSLSSNIVRAVLTYNGEKPVDPSGVAMTDIQFGICTKEVTEDVVSTNFDDYTIVPVDEAFSLETLDIAKNDRFRVGIRLISTGDLKPYVNEFGIMFESENGTKDRLNKNIM